VATPKRRIKVTRHDEPLAAASSPWRSGQARAARPYRAARAAWRQSGSDVSCAVMGES